MADKHCSGYEDVAKGHRNQFPETSLMHSSDSVPKMSNRGGLPIKNILTAAFILASLYLLYIYNGSRNLLHETEMTSDRFRREAEERVTEIQELVKAKDDLQERCENEKRELANRIKSINQQLDMLQSQHKETEADFMKLKQDMETVKSDHMQAESQHLQEYHKLKSEKDETISGLNDELRSLKMSNEELQNTVTALQTQIKNGQNVQQSLMDQNAKLQKYQQQQQLIQQQQLLQRQQEQQQQQQQQQQQVDLNKNQPVQAGQPQVGGGYGQNLHVPGGMQPLGGGLIQNMKIDGGVDNGQVQPNNEGLVNDQAVNQPNVPAQDQSGINKANLDDLNAQHQVLPPANPDNNLLDEHKNELNQVAGEMGEKRPEVNPNDLQKNQILEPNLDDTDINKANGGEDGVAHDSIRNAENDREREEADNTFMEHKDPLALGQMQQPGDLNHFEREGEGLGQQKAPIMSNEVDKNQDDKNGQDQAQAIQPVAP